MQRFFNTIIYYLGFLVAICNTKIVHRMWLCPLTAC